MRPGASDEPVHAVTRRLLVALAAVAALIVGGILIGAGRESHAPRLRPDSLSAEALVDSIGVNVHFSYVDTAYVRQSEVLARLRELGVHHIRDGMPNAVEAMRSGLTAASRQGLRGTLIGDPAADPALAVADSRRVMGNAIAAFEGPNELDASGNPAWASTLRTYMPSLEAAVRRHAPGVTVLGPSFIDPASRGVVPRLPGILNDHPYPDGGPPEPALGDALRELGNGAVERGLVFTETGYHNALAATTGQPPVSEEAAAVYLPRALVTAFGAGVRRTFVYELLDEKPDPGLVDPEQHFGLLRQDLSPKPAFSAIQSLIAALRSSPGERIAGPLSWRLRWSGDAEVKRLVLTRRDGSNVIALWRPISVWDQSSRRPVAPSPLRVDLSFDQGARNIAVWRPSVSAHPVVRRAYARRLSLELTGDLVLVSLR